MSAQLQELRAAAARRRQQNEGPRVSLQSPAVSDYDAESMHSLRSAASSRRSHLSRSSILTLMAIAKSDPFTSVQSQAESYVETEEKENVNPNEYHDAAEDRSVKSVRKREESKQANTPHQEKQFSEKFDNFRSEISGNLRIKQMLVFSVKNAEIPENFHQNS